MYVINYFYVWSADVPICSGKDRFHTKTTSMKHYETFNLDVVHRCRYYHYVAFKDGYLLNVLHSGVTSYGLFKNYAFFIFGRSYDTVPFTSVEITIGPLTGNRAFSAKKYLLNFHRINSD